MCTVVTRWEPGAALRILAIRDEFISRDFDDPDEWWPEQPGVVGGRDRQAGGSWCVTDVAAGVTALVLNRIERRTGTPSRGVLPLAAVAAGANWPASVDHREMASFALVLAAPGGVSAWIWDATELTRVDLEPGTRLFTSRGIDGDDEKSARYRQRFAEQDWLDVLTASPPADDLTALVVRHQVDADTYATVLGQLITSRPGALSIAYSRTPWERAGWTEKAWS
ncbi:MAG TPA: NRDE family protein [Jatrophihabitans sp.]|nr:NRDE family protein [Jatrophihabitans sp.]